MGTEKFSGVPGVKTRYYPHIIISLFRYYHFFIFTFIALVTKQRDAATGQQSLLFQIDYQEIGEGIVPRHRFMSAYEQHVEPPDKRWQYLLFAAEPYETISFKVLFFLKLLSRSGREGRGRLHPDAFESSKIILNYSAKFLKIFRRFKNVLQYFKMNVGLEWNKIFDYPPPTPPEFYERGKVYKTTEEFSRRRI